MKDSVFCVVSLFAEGGYSDITAAVSLSVTVFHENEQVIGVWSLVPFKTSKYIIEGFGTETVQSVNAKFRSGIVS